MKIIIEIFYAPGCNRCAHARQALKEIIEAMNTDQIQWRAINVLDEIDYAVELGVLSTPAIAIDGVLVFNALPNSQKLRATLKDRLKNKST